MTDNKRIKILYSYMIGVTSGGSDTCLFLLLKELDQTKYQPILLYKEKNSNVTKLEELGVQLIPWPGTNNNSSTSNTKRRNNNSVKKGEETYFDKFSGIIKRIIKNFPETLKLIKIIKAHDVDLVHCNHNLNSDRSMILAAIITKKRIISHNRGLYTPIRFDRIFSKHINKIINMSNFSNNLFVDNGIHKEISITLYDGIDIENFKSSKGRNNEIIIGCVGRLEKWKGQHILIEAAEIVAAEFPSIKFQLIGDGSYEAELRKLVNSKNLNENIEFTGGVTNVREYMDNCSVIVHTSIEPEPFGMVVIEAMALEKPVIATNFGGPVEIIDNEVNGFLIPAENPQILADYLLRLIKDSKLRLEIGTIAKQKVIEKFNTAKYCRQVETVYEEILN